MTGLQVVLGGSGGIGGAVVRELAAKGLRVRSVSRNAAATVPEGVTHHAADVATPAGAALPARERPSSTTACSPLQPLGGGVSRPQPQRRRGRRSRRREARCRRQPVHVLADRGRDQRGHPAATDEQERMIRKDCADALLAEHAADGLRVTIGRPRLLRPRRHQQHCWQHRIRSGRCRQSSSLARERRPVARLQLPPRPRPRARHPRSERRRRRQSLDRALRAPADRPRIGRADRARTPAARQAGRNIEARDAPGRAAHPGGTRASGHLVPVRGTVHRRRSDSRPPSARSHPQPTSRPCTRPSRGSLPRPRSRHGKEGSTRNRHSAQPTRMASLLATPSLSTEARFRGPLVDQTPVRRLAQPCGADLAAGRKVPANERDRRRLSLSVEVPESACHAGGRGFESRRSRLETAW